MADELLRSRHAFGNSSGIENALQQGIIDERDILFLDENTDEPKIGWVTKEGKVVILTDEKADLSKVEEDVDALEASVSTLETEMSKKADAETVSTELNELNVDIQELVSDVTACENTHLKVKYEVSDVPVGTIIDYREDEIRIMCSKNTVFTKQSVGSGGDENCYYLTFKTYVPNDKVVGYKEHLGDQVDNEILMDLKTDSYGRKYQPTWLALAKCGEDGTWAYYGKNSSKNHYIGWDYRIDWYDTDGIMIASDSIRINLSNEDCHYTAEPYYVSSANAEIVEEAVTESKLYTDAQVQAAIMEACAVIEF